MYLGFKDKKEFESVVGQKFIDNNLLLIPLSEDFIISNQNSDNDAFSVLHVDCHYIGKDSSFLSGEFDIICIDRSPIHVEELITESIKEAYEEVYGENISLHYICLYRYNLIIQINYFSNSCHFYTDCVKKSNYLAVYLRDREDKNIKEDKEMNNKDLANSDMTNNEDVKEVISFSVKDIFTLLGGILSVAGGVFGFKKGKKSESKSRKLLWGGLTALGVLGVIKSVFKLSDSLFLPESYDEAEENIEE